MTPEEIRQHLYRPGDDLPPLRPCDTPNAGDRQVDWSAEELHRITGCRKFRNYKHLVVLTSNGCWVGGGEFPDSLGTFSTVR